MGLRWAHFVPVGSPTRGRRASRTAVNNSSVQNGLKGLVQNPQKARKKRCAGASVRRCVSASVRQCVGASVRRCVGAPVRQCVGVRSSEIGDRSWGGAVRRCVSGPEQTAASGRNRNLDPNAIHSFRESGEGITITITFKSERNDHYRSIVCPAACVLCTAVPRNLPSRRRISEGRSHARRRGPVGEPCQSWIRDARRSSLRPSVAAQPDCLSVVQFGPVTVIEGDSPQRRREHREDRS